VEDKSCSSLGLTDAKFYPLLAFKAQGMIWVNKNIMS